MLPLWPDLLSYHCISVCDFPVGRTRVLQWDLPHSPQCAVFRFWPLPLCVPAITGRIYGFVSSVDVGSATTSNPSCTSIGVRLLWFVTVSWRCRLGVSMSQTWGLVYLCLRSPCFRMVGSLPEDFDRWSTWSSWLVCNLFSYFKRTRAFVDLNSTRTIALDYFSCKSVSCYRTFRGVYILSICASYSCCAECPQPTARHGLRLVLGLATNLGRAEQ